jgi:hypothetical protein
VLKFVMAAKGDLYQVVTSSYVAGIVVENGRVVKAAPILRAAVGKPLEELRRQVEARGGTVAAVVPGQP